MFAGHLGAGLLLKRLEPKVGLGSLFLAAMLLDAVLWLLLPLGLESLRLPAHFDRMSDLQFDFPYSHSLLASVLWSAVAALVWRMAFRRHASTRRGGDRPRRVFALYSRLAGPLTGNPTRWPQFTSPGPRPLEIESAARLVNSGADRNSRLTEHAGRSWREHPFAFSWLGF